MLKAIIESMTEDERIDFLERAGIMEFDGGLSRTEAEQEALKIIKGNELSKKSDQQSKLAFLCV